jgi:Leucine-rich repeat (LRR) protein
LLQLPALENLNASYCNIRALPKSASEKNWNQLSLAGNLLENMPYDLKAKDLNLSANPYLDLTSLFKNLSTCKNLKKLDVSYNKWQSLPADLGLLSNVSSFKFKRQSN